ncbi:MAG: porin family protein [Methylobacteriaceae bacterium]|nr:porin family protein [Methylobacteriaceae bacterium]
MLRSWVGGIAVAMTVGGTALAADLPVRRAPPLVAAPVVFSWTGCSFGTLTGYAVSNRQPIRTVGNTPATATNVGLLRRPPLINSEQDGFTSFGGGAGCDYQFTPGNGLVIGGAADATWTDLYRNRNYFGPALAVNGFVPDPSQFRQGLDWLGTARGRVGWGYDRFLIYGTGGLAFGNVFYRARFFNGAGQLAFLGQYDDISTGTVYGGGIEYALPADSFLGKYSLLGLLGIQSSAITAKFEYLRYDLGRRNVLVNTTGFTPAVGSYTSRFSTAGDLFRGGLTYRFNAF